MRIISQDGARDIPYERVIVAMDMGNPNIIRACDDIRSGYYLILAEYPSITQVRVALDEMRKAYREGKEFFQFP